MDQLIPIFAKFDVVNLIALVVLLWILKSHLDKKFVKIDEEFKSVRDEIKELRTSLNRMEGAFYSKDCCMLKEDKQNKKAE